MNESIASFALQRAEDVFALRQSGRVAAGGIGCDEADQVRFATALSEIGREALSRSTASTAIFSLEGGLALHVVFEHFPRLRGRVDTALIGLQAARKLVDEVAITDNETSSSVVVSMRSRTSGSRSGTSAAQLREKIHRSAAPRPLDELRLENRDLVATLSELKFQQDQLVQLNAELEETNRGVVAMYAQLADELEETNRGVVALYAELDDKTIRLNEANEAKSRFLANVSHELRSPVNSILGLVQLLADPFASSISDDQRKQLSLVASSGAELLLLVNQLLDIAKAESGRLDPEVRRIDLAERLAELRGALRPLVRPGVKLEFDLPDLPPVETDPVLLIQVLRNLLTNALKFTPAGKVRLAVRLNDAQEIIMSVIDSGIGIAPADQAKVFEEFFQVRGPLQADRKGTGLGLPYARRVTQTLGGHMTMESEPGHGSTFTVRIPLHWQPLLRAAESPGVQPVDDVTVPTALIIDDDPSFRTTLRGMLQGIASRVLEAGGGMEGLKLMRDSPPDIVFVDLRMPDLDGSTVLAEIMTDLRLRNIRTVIVTSMQLTSTLRAALGPATAVLAKEGVTRESVRKTVADALRVEAANI